MNKIIKRYISQKVVESNRDYFVLRCFVEYIDGSRGIKIEFRDHIKGFNENE